MPRIPCLPLRLCFERDLVGSAAAFELAQTRHRALTAFASLEQATAAAARARKHQERFRDSILGPLVAEFQATHASVWSVAAILSMSPALASLVRAISGRGDRNEARASVLLAFLEAVSRIRTDRRIGFRLYSETRRRVWRVEHAHREQARCTVYGIVEHLTHGSNLEGALDVARFARWIRDLPPAPGERPVAYLDRVLPLRSRAARLERSGRLRGWQSASIADLHARLRSLSSNDTEGAR